MKEWYKYGRIIAYIMALTPHLLILNILNAIAVLVGIAVRLSFIAAVFEQRNIMTIHHACILTVGIILVDITQNYLQFCIQIQNDKADDKILQNIISRTYELSYDEAQKKDLYSANRNSVFDLVYIGGYAGIVGIIFNALCSCTVFVYFVIVLINLFAGLQINEKFMCMILFCFFIILMIGIHIQKKEYRDKNLIMDKILQLEKVRNYYIYSLINNYSLHAIFKAYDFSNYLNLSYRELNNESYQYNADYMKQMNYTEFKGTFANMIFMSVMVLICTMHILNGNMSLAMFPFYVSLAIQTGISSNDFILAVSNIRRKKPYMLELEKEVEKIKESEKNCAEFENVPEKISSIEFRNVYFKYPNVNDYLFCDLSFTIDFSQNKSCVIVGENGSGKTTMLKLITGILQPERGEILVNGISLKKFHPKDWISHISVILQDYSLFDGTVLDNIVVNRPTDEKKLAHAIRKANADKILKQMGLDATVESVDSHDIKLSGGERQKVALSRMLYGNSHMYFMDEPTAAFDPVSEHDFFSDFIDNYKNDFVLMITHRILNCSHFDYVYVMKNGRLEQQGTYETLKEKGYFGELICSEMKSLVHS